MTHPLTTNTRPLAVAAALGTLPYLLLKAFWLTGNPVGVTDPALIASPSMVALNAATVVLDLAVVALAFTLTSAWGRRLPAVAVLLPAWVATGLLGPIALAGLPAALVVAASGSGDALGLAGWVRPMVYGGFTWQAVFLLAAFAVYARSRWSSALWRPAPVDGPVATLLRACVGGGVTMAVLGTALALLGGVLDGGWVPIVGAVANDAFPLAGAVGVLALVRGRAIGRARTAAVVAAWSGSSAAFSGGLWTAVTTLGTTDLAAAGNPAAGLAQLCCLLAGFALAVAGLLAVSGEGSADDATSVPVAATPADAGAVPGAATPADAGPVPGAAAPADAGPVPGAAPVDAGTVPGAATPAGAATATDATGTGSGPARKIATAASATSAAIPADTGSGPARGAASTAASAGAQGCAVLGR